MSDSNSMPLSSFPTEGDNEVVPAGLPSPAFSGAVGMDSSTSPSLPTAKGAQWNDDEDSTPSAGHLDPGGYDPNMSGPKASQDVTEMYAGSMDGSNGGMLPMDSAEDYHSWTRMEGYSQAFGSDSVSPQGDFSGLPDTISGIQVFPVVRRS
jgi:hypothetical protein